MAIFDPQRQMSIPHFQTPQYYSDLDTLAKLQKLFESQASAKRQEELHPFELSKAEKMNTRLDLMNEAGRQDIDFDKELHPYEVAYKQAVAEGQGILNKSNQQKMDFDAELHPIDMIYQRALADSAKATADFDKSTLQAKINDKLDEYSFNRNERPLKLSEIKARINSSNANTAFTNEQRENMRSSRTAAEKFIKDFTDLYGMTPEMAQAKRAMDEATRQDQIRNGYVFPTDPNYDPLKYDEDGRPFDVYERNRLKEDLAVSGVYPNDTAVDTQERIMEAYKNVKNSLSNIPNVSMRDVEDLFGSELDSFTKIYNTYKNDPSKLVNALGSAGFIDGTAGISAKDMQKISQLTNMLKGGDIPSYKANKNTPSAESLARQAIEDEDGNKLERRVNRGDKDAQIAQDMLMGGERDKIQMFYHNRKDGKLYEAPLGVKKGAPEYDAFIKRTGGKGFGTGEEQLDMYTMRPYETFESLHLPSTIGTYVDQDGNTRDIPGRGVGYNANIGFYRGIKKALDSNVYKDKEVVAGKLGRFISGVTSAMSDKEKQEFKEALYDPKNGRYAQEVVGTLAYLLSTTGEEGLNLQGSPGVGKAVLALMKNIDDTSYKTNLTNGDMAVFGSSAADVARMFEDMREAIKEVSKAKSKDGSFNRANNLMQNKNMITPTKKDKSNGKEEAMNYSVRYITPEYAKEILDRMERKALDRNIANEVIPDEDIIKKLTLMHVDSSLYQ